MAHALILLLVSSFFSETHAATCTSTGSGNWNASTSWSGCPGGGGIPNNKDDVIIQTGHIITLNTNSKSIDTLTLQVGAVLQGDGVSTLNLGRAGGEDVTNNGTINFSGATAATISLFKDSRWAGNGVWNLTAIDLSNNTLSFTAGTTTTINLSGAGDPILYSALSPGTITSLSTITWNYNGTAAQTLSNNANVTYGNVIVNNAAGVTLTRNLTTTNLLGNVSVQSGVLNDGGFSIQGTALRSFSVSNGATFNITNPAGMVTGFGTKTFGATSTVNYSLTGDQPVSAETYGHLVLSGGGTKTPAVGTTTIQGNFTLAAGVIYAGTTSNPAVNLAGNFSSSGTFNSGTGLFTFNGTNPQVLTGATTFTNLRLNNSNGLTINNDVTIANQLTLTSGVLTTGINVVRVTTVNCNASSVVRTSGYVAGFLQKRIPTGGSVACTFEIGGPGTYRPINTTFTSVTTAGNVTAWSSQSAGDHPNIVSSSINPLRSVNRYWNLTNGGVTFTDYSATFNFVAGDIDAGANTAVFYVSRYQAPSWFSATVGTRTGTSTQATGVTGFGDFAIGELGNAISNFLIDITAPAASTCSAKSITITARDASNNPLPGYTGTINISTSSNHGTWSKPGPPTGSLVDLIPDDGVASYAFVLADAGVVTLALTNTHADDLTVSVVDSGVPSTLSTSAVINFRDNVFVITNDPIQVAGRDQAMSAAMWKRDLTTGNCSIDTNYTGAKNLDAWLTRDPSDPGAVAPTIGAVSLPSAAPPINPAVNNLALTFAAGSANFNLTTTDVGRYVLNLRDDTRLHATGVDIVGASNSITTRPFGLHVNVPGNPAASVPGGAVFTSAGTNFSATVRGVLWQGTDDGNNDGVPDTGANLADNSVAPNYAWATALTRTSPFTPATPFDSPAGAGTRGALNNGAIAEASFSGGSATLATLQYTEVGSFTLQADATNYLNSGVNISTPNGVVGRFTPAYFDVIVTHGCSGGATFTYSGQSFSVTVSAFNAAGTPTLNFDSTLGFAKNVTITDADGDADPIGGFNTTNTLPGASAFISGVGSSTTIAYTFTVKETAPVTLNLRGTDIDLVSSAGHMEPTTQARSGRVVIRNAYGSELVDLAVPMRVQYYSSAATGFETNTADTCTVVTLSFPAFYGNLTAGETCVHDDAGLSGQGCTAPSGSAFQQFREASAPLFAGNLNLYLKAPGTGNNGGVDISTTPPGDLPVWLLFDWDGNGIHDNHPSGRATFGIYKGNSRQIYQRERY